MASTRKRLRRLGRPLAQRTASGAVDDDDERSVDDRRPRRERRGARTTTPDAAAGATRRAGDKRRRLLRLVGKLTDARQWSVLFKVSDDVKESVRTVRRARRGVCRRVEYRCAQQAAHGALAALVQVLHRRHSVGVFVIVVATAHDQYARAQRERRPPEQRRTRRARRRHAAAARTRAHAQRRGRDGRSVLTRSRLTCFGSRRRQELRTIAVDQVQCWRLMLRT